VGPARAFIPSRGLARGSSELRAHAPGALALTAGAAARWGSGHGGQVGEQPGLRLLHFQVPSSPPQPVVAWEVAGRAGRAAAAGLEARAGLCRVADPEGSSHQMGGGHGAHAGTGVRLTGRPPGKGPGILSAAGATTDPAWSPLSPAAGCPAAPQDGAPNAGQMNYPRPALT
jgi:hypothetical protein